VTALPESSGPTPEVLAAIIAAIEMAWPRPIVVAEPPAAQSGSWRFSGRWWSRPQTARRERPWLTLG
jgi:hypothetical protein